MSSEETEQGRNSSGRQQSEEVSLPGAGEDSLEDQSVLQVLYKTHRTPAAANVPDSALTEPESEIESESAAASGSGSGFEHYKPEKLAAETLNGGNIFDIESHLIETYDEYETKDEAIGINELSPIQDEITQHPCIIEVEPAGVKTIRPIETFLVSAQPSQVAADTDTDTAPAPSTDAKEQCEASEEIKESARQLVDEIEQQLLETFDKIAAAHAENEAAKAVAKAEAAQEANVPILPNGHESPDKTDEEKTRASTILSQKVDEQLSEVTSILKAGNRHQTPAFKVNSLHLTVPERSIGELKIVDVPSPKTELEIEERKLFITSLPQIGESQDASQLSTECKREYYQSLKKYLITSDTEKPLVPLQTYRWEDLRRAKERGGYPWTHLYKRPLGANQEPEIVLLLRKSQELRFASESPKSVKKVRIDQLVQVKETERYIQELGSDDDEEQQHAGESATEDEENHSLRSESISCASDSVLAAGKPRKTNRLANIRRILNRRRSGRKAEDAQSLPNSSTHTSRQFSEEELRPASTSLLSAKPAEVHKPAHCHPIVKKLKTMADRQKKRFNIKRIILRKNEKIVLADEPKILKLKSSPKSDRGEIPHFIEKQDSDDILEIVELDESPSRKHRDDLPRDEKSFEEAAAVAELDKPHSSIVEPNEIIELPIVPQSADDESQAATAGVSGAVEEATVAAEPPRKTPRLRREHVYEEIEQRDDVFEIGSVEALKQSLAKQDNSALKDVEGSHQPLPRDSSEEDQLTAVADSAAINAGEGKVGSHLLAPLSSIDSTSSDEDRYKTQLQPVNEESDAGSSDGHSHLPVQAPRIVENQTGRVPPESAMKKEASPAPSDKKVVTFSHVEDEAEPHREDITLPPSVLEATADANRWKNMSDHEYEPIDASPNTDEAPFSHQEPRDVAKQNMEIDSVRDKFGETEEKIFNENEQYLSSEAADPRSVSHTDNEVDTNEVNSSALDAMPLKEENRKRGFMATAQYQTQKLQAGFKNHAGKIKTKLRSPAKKSPQGSPIAKERKRFKAPEFSKIKMPKIKRPDVSKLKEFKRPEFTKFNKPDMSKFKLPEKFSTLKLHRSKSLKESEIAHDDDDETSGNTPESAVKGESQTPKKKLEFSFGTYPRAFRKKKAEVERKTSFETATTTEGLSIIASTDTQPSLESSSTPQGDRGPGPVRSRWADKFSDVSYNDSEGSRYRHGSEQESLYRESSLERRMKYDLEETGSDSVDMGILSGGPENKQFAEFDEENRAIHEISHLRADEFKRRPMVHQDSDLRSEDSKEAEGWTDREIQRNKLLRKAKLEAEASYLKYPSEEGIRQETQSSTSSGKKVVVEEIDDDEFFLRKRGISEDNIELRQYISNAIREGYDMPINALQHVGEKSEPLGYADYDVPPPKPRRLHRSYRPEDVSQEFERSERDDLSISQNGSDFFEAPKKPHRKESGRSKYSASSHEKSMRDDEASHSHMPRSFDDDEEYLRPPQNTFDATDTDGAGDSHFYGEKNVFPAEQADLAAAPPTPQPRAPRRRKRQARYSSSMDKDFYLNGFSGRSVSNSNLQPSENVIVYRTEHEYAKPLATPETFTDGERSTAAAPMPKPRTSLRYEEDDRTSRGAESLDLEANLQAEYEAETASTVQEKFVIDMMENDGYAVVRKEPLPKPTPPARRKKFSRSPGERFATMPNMRTKRAQSPPERPPPPRDYTASVEQPVPPRRKSTHSVEGAQNYEDDDYEKPGYLSAEEPERPERPESPRDLQSGAVINKMKFRPLPPPPRPPREKRTRSENKRNKGGDDDDIDIDIDYEEDNENENEENNLDRTTVTSSTADSYEPNDYPEEEEEEKDGHFAEVEVSTQTDPLPDDYFCEEFEITDAMRVIAPRRPAQTLDELLRQQLQADGDTSETQLTENEQLARGLQRFREANQRSLSERSRASSSLADRSKSLSRPQTPSAVVIERRVSTPVPSQHSETLVEAALIVRPIDDLDLEEAELRREGLLTDSSQHSKSDAESHDLVSGDDEDEKGAKKGDGGDSKYGSNASEDELDAAAQQLLAQGSIELEEQQEKEVLEDVEEEKQEDEEEDEEVERSMRNYVSDEDQADRYSSRYEEDNEERTEHGDTDQKSETDEQEVTPAAGRSPVPFTETPPYTPYEERLHEKESYGEDAPVEKPELKLSATHDYKLGELNQEKSDQASLIDEAKQLEKPSAEPEQSPQPPPRRKSTTTLDLSQTVVPQPLKLTTVDQSTVGRAEQLSQNQLPGRIGDLEVERLRVHALQAGQIMVSQLHGGEISSDELSCKSGNLVVNRIELPAGFIEDIVERVRHTDQSKLLTAETQTSLQASSEELGKTELTPPPKPPRQRDLEATLSRTSASSVQAANSSATPPPLSSATETLGERQPNKDELTQTDPTEPLSLYPNTEYLQSLGPLAFYNMRSSEGAAEADEMHRCSHHRHHHHHHHRCLKQDSFTSSEASDAEGGQTHLETRHERHERRQRSQSSNRQQHPPEKSVMEAGRQFISACSLSLVNIINQLTACVQGAVDKEQIAGTRLQHIPTLVVLFIAITFALLIYLLSGKSVHTHHWDHFNPPSNEARPS